MVSSQNQNGNQNQTDDALAQPRDMAKLDIIPHPLFKFATLTCYSIATHFFSF